MEQPNYAKQLLLQLNQQRSKGYLCDVIIVVENALFRAHKTVLAASSSYFKSLVLHDNLINLDTEMVSPSVFKQVLDFIYTGRLPTSDPVSDQGLSALLTAASYLQLSELASLCCRRLKRNGRIPSSTSKMPSSTTLSASPNGRFHPNTKRLASSTPVRVTPGHGSGSSKASRNQKPEGRLKEDLSEEEGFISGLRCASLSPSGEDRLGSGEELRVGLGLDLSKKSPTGSTATEEVSPSSLPLGSPHSGSHSPTIEATSNSTTVYNYPRPEASEAGDVQPSPKTQMHQQQRSARKRSRPSNEGSAVGRAVNGLAMGPKGRGDSVSPDMEEQEEDVGVLENGLEQSEESGQSESECRVGSNLTRKANYVYRQPQPGFQPAFGDNLYVCIPCGKGFPSSEQLNAHVDTHTADELHIKEEHDDEEEGGSLKDQDEEPGDGLTITTEVESDTLSQHACTVCSKSYKDLASLRQHEKSHWLSRPFPCNICGKLFTQRGTMTRHMRSHLGLKPFACEECGMRFTRQYRLAEHSRVHSGEKPYECQLCGGKFTQQRNLISHLRMHTSPS